MAGKFDNKVVMITGAAGNLGSAVTRAFAAETARLVMVERARDRMDALAADLSLDEDHYLPLIIDVTQPDSVDDCINQTLQKFGPVDVLIHTVGGFAMGDPVHAGNYDVWDKMITLNARATYILCGRIAKHMLDHNVTGGSISMILAKAGLGGMANGAAYAASKAAAQRIMQSMAAELKGQIRVNGILPSIIDTPPNRQDMPNADFSKWVQPEEIARALLFLASDEASGVTGASLEVPGRV